MKIVNWDYIQAGPHARPCRDNVTLKVVYEEIYILQSCQWSVLGTVHYMSIVAILRILNKYMHYSQQELVLQVFNNHDIIESQDPQPQPVLMAILKEIDIYAHI